MILSVLRETQDSRVALGPKEIKKLLGQDISIQVESDAGKHALITDQDYTEAGAKIVDRSQILSSSSVIVSVNPLPKEDLAQISKGSILISTSSPDEANIASITSIGLTGFGLDRMPRTTRAQAMDVLSSMASLAGYRAVLLGALHFPAYFPMMMTAAGTIPPGKVLILGVGVAGLQAIATAKRLGAQVEAFDIRPETRTEVKSLGARFVELPENREQANQKMREHIAKSNVIITAAQSVGKKAPILVNDEALAGMRPGSVIVDTASGTGGNCSQTVKDQIIDYNGITIIGNSNLAGEMPVNASNMLSTNFYHFLNLLIEEGKPNINMEDDIIAATCYTAN